jgi:UDP-N-acetylglucosamine 2-epimerase (non-hydrolysing)
MKLLLVAGARPNFMKVASIVEALDAHNRTARNRLDYLLIHTGQHYDERMSRTFFRELGLPRPAVDLEVGSGSHAVQTAEIMKRFENARTRSLWSVT